MPPFTTPAKASCSGFGANRATRVAASSSDGRLATWSPAGLAGPQPKQRPAGANRSWRLASFRPTVIGASIAVTIEMGRRRIDTSL